MKKIEALIIGMLLSLAVFVSVKSRAQNFEPSVLMIKDSLLTTILVSVADDQAAVYVRLDTTGSTDSVLQIVGIANRIVQGNDTIPVVILILGCKRPGEYGIYDLAVGMCHEGILKYTLSKRYDYHKSTILKVVSTVMEEYHGLPIKYAKMQSKLFVIDPRKIPLLCSQLYQLHQILYLQEYRYFLFCDKW
ncbi:MAG: hypothetical protein NZL83_02520 [Candidatus Absconditabacterales bacterium]|nr:hypothetical protein [Candidatus Absconditabacterales bacterium]